MGLKEFNRILWKLNTITSIGCLVTGNYWMAVACAAFAFGSYKISKEG